jgi:hypothetical protein
MASHHVGVSLDDDRAMLASDLLLRQVDAIEQVALLVDRRLGFTGDLESRSIGQVSNPFSIPDRCVVIDRLPPNSPIVSPTTARASTPIRAVTHTEILTNTDTPTSSTEQATDTSTSSAAVIAPVAAAAARHTQSSGATPIIIGIAAVMVIAILAGGTVIARRRSH